MNNKSRYCINSLMDSLLLIVLSGAVFQTFLLEKGYGEQKVSWFLSAVQIIQMFSTLAFSKKADNMKNIIKVSSVLCFLEIPLCIFLLVNCFVGYRNVLYYCLAAVGLIYGAGRGISNIVGYKLPYNIMDIRDYGSISSLAGILAGIICTAFSVLLSYLQNKLPYFVVMNYVYLLALIFIVGRFLIIRTMCPNKEENLPVKKDTKRINLFKYSPFTRLIIPNLMRGFCCGITALSITIGYHTGLVDNASSGFVVVAANVVMILGCFVYMKINVRVSDKNIILAASAAIAILLPMMIAGSTKMFVAFYAMMYFFETIINYVIPVTVTKIVDYEIIGQYTAGRMLIHTLGTALGGFVCVGMLNVFGSVQTLCFAGFMQLLSGVAYYMYLRRAKLHYGDVILRKK